MIVFVYIIKLTLLFISTEVCKSYESLDLVKVWISYRNPFFVRKECEPIEEYPRGDEDHQTNGLNAWLI